MQVQETIQKAESEPKRFSDKSLTGKASLNSLSALLDYGAKLLTGFLLNPLLVAGLGPYLYGSWQILSRLCGYVSAASGRPTQALQWTIANHQASTDYEQKRRNVGGAVAVWLLFLPLLATAGGVLAWFSPSWLKAPVEFSRTIRLAAALLVADLIMNSVADVPRGVLRGENLGYKRMGLSTLLVFVGGGFAAAALYFHTGMVGVALANLAETILTGAFFLKVVRHCVHWFGIALPSFPEVRRFFGLSWWFLAWRLVNQLIMGSDVVVLGKLDSVELVATYTLTKYAPETLISLMAIMVGGMTPGLGGIIGSGNFHKAIRIRSEILSIAWLVATVVGTTALLWNRAFITLWVGNRYYAGSITTLLIMLMATQFVLIRIDAFIIDLTLKLSHKVLIGALSAGVSIVFAGFLLGYFRLGIPGLCLGFIAGRSILSLGYPWLIGQFFRIKLRSQFKDVWRPMSVMAGSFILSTILGSSLTAKTWIGLILSVGLTVVLVFLLAFYAGLSSGQRRSTLERAQAIIRSIRHP